MSENAIITVEPEVRLGSLTVLHPVDMIARASEIATALAKVIKDRKLSRVISGREYVYVDGWSTMGAMIGILPREVPDATRELENGDYTAAVELIRVSDGAVIGYGSAIVGFDESTWKNRPRYAKRSMAITRATGKAYRLGFSWIISLAGYATTPAEEMDGMDEAKAAVQPPTPANGKQAEKPATTTEQPPAEEVNPNADSKGKLFADMDIPELAGHLTEYEKRKKADPTDQVNLAKYAAAKAVFDSKRPKIDGQH